MLTSDLLAFVRSSLPPPPARVLEVGAGDGELAAALRSAGYDVTAIDPAAEPGSGVEPIALIDATGQFDAAVGIVSLHHVEPLEQSFAHLATLIKPGGMLVIDELDRDNFDRRAAAWWVAQQRALGSEHGDLDPDEVVAEMQHHIHAAEAVLDALRPHFDVGLPVRGPYLHRWELPATLITAELELIASGDLPPVGWRTLAACR